MAVENLDVPHNTALKPTPILKLCRAMRYIFCILVCLAAANITPLAQETARASVFEYAIVKWNGTDRLYYSLPNQFELVQMKDRKVPMPKDAQPEEFWLTYAANEMAKQGWEAVNLNSRRILFRRVKK